MCKTSVDNKGVKILNSWELKRNMQKSTPSSIRLRYETTKNLQRQISKRTTIGEIAWEATRGHNAPIASDMDASHALIQNLTIPEWELFLSNAWPSSTLELCTAYATVINIKSDADQPDAAQAKLHVTDTRSTDSPVSDVSNLLMSSTSTSTSTTINRKILVMVLFWPILAPKY